MKKFQIDHWRQVFHFRCTLFFSHIFSFIFSISSFFLPFSPTFFFTGEHFLIFNYHFFFSNFFNLEWMSQIGVPPPPSLRLIGRIQARLRRHLLQVFVRKRRIEIGITRHKIIFNSIVQNLGITALAAFLTRITHLLLMIIHHGD